MRHKRVADVMTGDVVTVRTDTPFDEVVRTLATHHISGAPVLDDGGNLVGMVTEADLLGTLSQSAGSNRWNRILRYNRAPRHGTLSTAANLMTTPAVTVTLGDQLTTAASILAHHDIKRAPVLDETGALAGVVSRKDLLSVYLRPDADTGAEIRSEVLSQAMHVPPDEVSVEVEEGIVTLTGQVQRQSMIEIITVLTGAVDGVVDVRNELTAREDDTRTPTPPPGSMGVIY